MFKYECCKGPEETANFLNSLEGIGYDVTTDVIITQENNYFTIFYKS